MIFIIERIFPGYRKAILDRLATKYKLHFLHTRTGSSISQVSAPYSVMVKSFFYSRNETNMFLLVSPHIIKHKPAVVIHELAMGIISLPFTFLLSKAMGIKFVLWGHIHDRKKGFHPERSMKDRMRLLFLRKADAVIAYSRHEKEILSAIIPAEKIFVAQNTLDIPRLSGIRQKLESEGKHSVKKRLGFTHKYNLVFIGRLLPAKHPEVLVKIYEGLREILNNDIGIHFVGEGPCLAELKEEVSGKGYQNNFRFHGTLIDDEKTGAILYASDMMVMPGYLGLSVNHAFCFDCPVISFEQGENGPFHSPEVEYVVQGRTGFLTPPDNVKAMTKQIADYLQDETLKAEMKKNIIHTVNNICTIGNMEKGFADCLQYLGYRDE